jgi:hypothetical protein
MEGKLFTLLGLGVPFYLAAATYAVFSWLDSNASDEATKVGKTRNRATELPSQRRWMMRARASESSFLITTL